MQEEEKKDFYLELSGSALLYLISIWKLSGQTPNTIFFPQK